jgi:hypothetical protein
MTDITALDGTVMHINDNSVIIVSGPLPGDPPDISYVTGPAPAVIETGEDAATLVASLHPTVPLALFTRPNGTPVWIKGGAVSLVRVPIVGETPPGETVGAVIFIGAHQQAVEEDVATARAIINNHGGAV